MGLSRKTKKARTVSSLRKEESPESQQIRLKNNRERMSRIYKNKSPESKRELLNKIKENKSQRRKRESDCEREKRLEKQRIRMSLKRSANESPSSRCRRLANMREYASFVRANESPSARSQRLAAMRERATLVRQNESPTVRAERLAAMREYASLIRQNESPATRLERLTYMREHASFIRQNESLSSQSERLTQMRVQASQSGIEESPTTHENRVCASRVNSFAHFCRSQLFPPDAVTAFQSDMLKVADCTCYACRQMSYDNQTRDIDTSHYTVIPEHCQVKTEQTVVGDDSNGVGKDIDDLGLTTVTLAATFQESKPDPKGRINTYEIFNVMHQSQHSEKLLSAAANSQEDNAIEKDEQGKKRSRTSERTNTITLIADEALKQENEQDFTIVDLKDVTQIDKMSAEEQLDNSLKKEDLKPYLLEPDPLNPDTCSIQMKMGEQTYRRKFLMSDTMEDIFNYASSQPEAPARFGILTGSPNMIYHCKLQSDLKSQTLEEVGFHSEQVIFIVDEQSEHRI